jgi:hypothetical protein
MAVVTGAVVRDDLGAKREERGGKERRDEEERATQRFNSGQSLQRGTKSRCLL